MNIYLSGEEITGVIVKVYKRWADPPVSSDDSQFWELQKEIEDTIAKAAADNAVREVVEWVETHRYKTKYLEGDVMIAAEEYQELKALVTEKEKG